MKKRALRLLLGAGYVILLTFLLLYQTGALGERRQWRVAALTTLFLGIALAVVLVLYLRVNDQIGRQERYRSAVAEVERKALAAQAVGGKGKEAAGQVGTERETDGQEKSVEEKGSLANRSYEEIYAHFLMVMENCALSERELEVAWLLYRGYTNRQIGEELYIAETTVKKHVSHIYQKMNVQSRKEFRAYVQFTAVPAPFQTDPPA